MADYSGGELLTTTPTGSFPGSGTLTDVDNIRRKFGIGDKVHELAPETSIFFSYLSKLGKKTTDETVWKPLEYRNQWQRRNFYAEYSGADGDAPVGIKVTCKYNNKGEVKSTATDATNSFSPIFLVPGQVLRINGVPYKIASDATIDYIKTVAGGNDTDSTTGKGTTAGDYALIPDASLTKVSDGSGFPSNGSGDGDGQVIGSQWAEASGAPDGWRDELSAVEFYTQIFKTSVPLMSGSMQATRYRGYANEWKRIYAEHLKSHKMDLENAFLFGHGKYVSADERYSWGILPFLENNGGKKYELDYNGTSIGTAGYDVSAGFSYDGMVDVMDDFMNWEGGNSGQKLCLTSRKVINALHKVGSGTFLKNSFGTESNNPTQIFSANLDVKSSSFMPIDITSISTSWGSMNFIAHPLFRGDMEDKCVCIDLDKVSLRPLVGNGISRDTFVETNIQENDIDGRKDMIITEAGLEVMLPECHAVIDFKAS